SGPTAVKAPAPLPRPVSSASSGMPARATQATAASTQAPKPPTATASPGVVYLGGWSVPQDPSTRYRYPEYVKANGMGGIRRNEPPGRKPETFVHYGEFRVRARTPEAITTL